MMDWLRREIAPLSDKIWKEIDEAVIRTARHTVAGRRIADFDGPRGWDFVGIRQGTFHALPGMKDSRADLSLPDIVLLAEIRAGFSLPWAAVEVFERGGPVLDTAAAEEAARAVALAEDRIVFGGHQGAAGLLGSPSSPRRKLGDWTQPGQAEQDLLAAIETLDQQGIEGPYDIVLDSSYYYTFYRATAQGGGYPASRQIKDVVRNVHRSLVVEGGAVFSSRGDDFVVTVGGDLSVGYRAHDEGAVHLFCAESVAAQLLTPQAVFILERA